MALTAPALASSQRATAQRRMRRRSLGATRQLFCGTNGCATYLEADERAGVATCPVCGFRRRLR